MLDKGKTIELFKLTNKRGMSIRVTNYAASLTFVSAPDRNGIFEPVVLGFDSLSSYLGNIRSLALLWGGMQIELKMPNSA